MSIPRPCAADPILRSAELARASLAPPASRKQDLMHFPDEPGGKWKALSETGHTVLQCAYVP